MFLCCRYCMWQGLCFSLCDEVTIWVIKLNNLSFATGFYCYPRLQMTLSSFEITHEQWNWLIRFICHQTDIKGRCKIRGEFGHEVISFMEPWLPAHWLDSILQSSSVITCQRHLFNHVLRVCARVFYAFRFQKVCGIMSRVISTS